MEVTLFKLLIKVMVVVATVAPYLLYEQVTAMYSLYGPVRKNNLPKALKVEFKICFSQRIHKLKWENFKSQN